MGKMVNRAVGAWLIWKVGSGCFGLMILGLVLLALAGQI